MPDEETQLAQDAGAEDNGEIRKKAMTRLIVAGVVTTVALGALWWLDRDSGPEKKKPAKTPAPIVSAPAPIVEPPAPTASTPADEAKPEPPPPPEVPEAKPETKLAETATGNKKPPATPTSAAPLGATEKAAPSAPKPGVAAAPGMAQPPTKPATSPVPAGTAPSSAKALAPSAYVVQLGVFADPANAKDLVERLGKLGVQARMETRVQVGPFDKREEAEKARAAMLKLGVKGVVATK